MRNNTNISRINSSTSISCIGNSTFNFSRGIDTGMGFNGGCGCGGTKK